MGLDKLKESEAEPFNATLDAPNDFEIVGGRIVGGAKDPPDEPPPHAEQQRAPKKITIRHHARDVRVGNFRFAPGHHTEGRFTKGRERQSSKQLMAKLYLSDARAPSYEGWIESKTTHKEGVTRLRNR